MIPSTQQRLGMGGTENQSKKIRLISKLMRSMYNRRAMDRKKQHLSEAGNCIIRVNQVIDEAAN